VADPRPTAAEGATPKGSPLDTSSALTQHGVWPADFRSQRGSCQYVAAPRGPSRQTPPGTSHLHGDRPRDDFIVRPDRRPTGGDYAPVVPSPLEFSCLLAVGVLVVSALAASFP
jgi:hypothetical protein